jgi:hypothetical protein
MFPGEDCLQTTLYRRSSVKLVTLPFARNRPIERSRLQPDRLRSGFRVSSSAGNSKTLGAPPMKRTVQKFIGDAIRESLKAGTLPSGTLAVSPLNDRLIIQ